VPMSQAKSVMIAFFQELEPEKNCRSASPDMSQDLECLVKVNEKIQYQFRSGIDDVTYSNALDLDVKTCV